MAHRQGRGSGAVALAAVLLHAHVAESAVFTVGDRGGWSFSTGTWTNGKRFKAGDVLGTVPVTFLPVASIDIYPRQGDMSYAYAAENLGRPIELNTRHVPVVAF